MIFLFLLLSFSIYSRDIGFLLVSSTKTLEHICNLASKKNMKISFSYVGEKPDACNVYDLEYVEYVKFPIGIFSSKGKEKVFLNFSDLSLSKDFFECIYFSNLTSKSLGLFIEGSFLPLSMWDLIPSSFLWVSGGVVNYDAVSSLYEYNGRKIIFFELLKSTSQLLTSSSTLFLVDERVFQGNVISIFDSFSDKLNMVKVLDVIYSMSSSSEIVSYFPYYNFLNNLDINFLYFINRISKDVFSYRNEVVSSQVISSLCDLVSLYPPRSDNLDEFYEKARNISFEVYSLLSIPTPSFIYDDFLLNNISDYKIEKTTSSVKYICNKSTFSLTLNEDSALFSIDVSSFGFNDIHIYIDINKRAGQGSSSVIFKSEKIDNNLAWEYAFIINSKNARFYRSTTIDYKLLNEFPVLFKDGIVIFKVPIKYLVGNPLSWRYIVIVWKGEKNIYGFFRKVSPNVITSIYD
ncbi:MAG: hypothetical protein N2446_04035 [Elusimicrobiales bacterium]|nr:hypothetical protein [Elusimicrobiales bacterium]